MKKERRKARIWRSHRRLREVLFAFAAAGAVLGLGLLAIFFYQRHAVMLWLGFLYVMFSGFLFGVCRVMKHLDDLHRRKNFGTRKRDDFGAI